MKIILHKIKQAIFHSLQLYPIYGIINTINRHYPLKNCHALEAFAFTGALQARAYKHYPAYHETWEISEDCRAALHRNLPGATIRITNSFEEITRCKRKFNFINVDTHQGLFGSYCENFEIFPLLFNVTSDECVVNLNVIPFAGVKWKMKYPDLFNKEHLARRKAFYNTTKPENVDFRTMLLTYSKIAAQHNYVILWHAILKRTLTYYLALHLKKRI
ncbi:MAG TPA: hypothetical protein PL029_09575 [Bacteroidia bacterium]|nr:hypothetical protein [Bacteroidia bacterium]